MLFQNLLSKENLINIFLLIIPISYIFGNFALNLNIIILILISLYFFKGKIFSNKFSNLDKIIVFFFFYIFANGIYNNFFNLPEDVKGNFILIKSFFFMRILILYFILKFLIKEKVIKLEKIFKFYSFVVIFVCLDLFFQFFVGFDLFGFEGTSRRLSGPFGDELIAGSFIQRFFIFPLYAAIFFFSSKKNWVSNLLIFFIINLSALGILLSGNRMPFLLFSMMLTFFFFFKPEVRKPFLLTIVCLILSFSYLLNSNINFSAHYSNILVETKKIADYMQLKISGENMLHLKSTYIKEIESGILTWQENKILGGGIKSFYNVCSKIDPEKWTLSGGVNCNQHPHNYYLETAANLGVLGLLIFLIMIFKIIWLSLKKCFSIKNSKSTKSLIISFLIVFVAEIFPLKTTGSLFTTSNSIFLFFIIAFIAGLIENNFEKKFT